MSDISIKDIKDAWRLLSESNAPARYVYAQGRMIDLENTDEDDKAALRFVLGETNGDS